jgi:hypothetical protein
MLKIFENIILNRKIRILVVGERNVDISGHPNVIFGGLTDTGN